jgi:hypothetical protein
MPLAEKEVDFIEHWCMLFQIRGKVMLSYSKGSELPLRCETVYQAFAAAAT